MVRTILGSTFANPRKPFRFVGRYSFLDFINTEASEADGRADLLTSDQDFVAWLVLAKLFERNKLKVALKQWQQQKTGVRVWKDALALRALMRRMVEAIVADRPIPRASIDAINELIGQPSGITRIVKTPRKFERRFESELNQPRQLLVPLAESAADMLCHGDLSRLKRCGNSKCGAFFYDTSKNRMRRWCSGTECGNRMRVAKFYARRRRDD
jgi:predicted RNA-binding Zn ribbon-like protein